MNNSIYQFSIGELLDGRYFFIPAYQRGYRWTEKQVGDLLQDLLSFSFDKDKKDDEFYCLQPIIVKPIIDNNKIKSIFKENNINDVIEKTAWEVVDGQQRLTTILLLYKYLLNKNPLFKEDTNRIPYKIVYETREKSAELLNNISYEYIINNQNLINENIDFYHISNAYLYFEDWIKDKGINIALKYANNDSFSKIISVYYELLNSKKSSNKSVQVLWYQLSNKIDNSTREFQKINTGKIKLTNAELIKGLFLLKRNFSSESKLAQLALEWEFIENTLQSNKFWFFIQKNDKNISNRIDFIFSTLYKIEQLRNIDETNIEEKLKDLKRLIEDEKQSVTFRYYFNKFEGLSGENLNNEIDLAWKDVMNLFRILDDWFNSPLYYNYIGFLSQCGEDISRLIYKFSLLPEESYRNEFQSYLEDRIKYYLKGIDYDNSSNKIITQYDSNNTYLIRRLLLAFNIEILNEQNKKLNIYSEIYKFPFDLLNSQEWDIEHIDSVKANELKSNDDKISWIKTAMGDLKELDDVKKKEINKRLNSYSSSEDLNLIIEEIKQFAKEDEEEQDSDKNSIGNLTLLDSKTNRSYGNSLFCTKRRIILNKIKNGLYVPVGTKYIFAKLFDEYGTNRNTWTKDDMEKYHKYIIEKISKYLYSAN